MLDVALIKVALFEKNELTEWAKIELKKARDDSEESYTSLEEL